VARQPALQTPRGVIRPACCRTDEWGYPPGPNRLDDHHVGTRFGDRNNGSGEWHVLLNGEDVTEHCVEALAGDNGFVIVYDLDGVTGWRYLCPFGPRIGNRAHALVVKKFGRVDVVRVSCS
jgi:hypothetical protein